MPRSRRSLAVLVILLLGFAGLTALHAPGALAASGTVTVTANGSPAGVNARVVVLTGAKETGGASVGGSNTSGAPHFSLTPNASRSLPLFALYDQTGGSSGEYTAEPSNSFTFNGTTDNGKQHDAFADGQYTGTVTGGTAVTLGSTTPTGGDKQVWAAYEIEAAGGSSPAVDTSTPALVFSSSANSVTTASFTPPAGAVLAVLASGNNASSIAVSDSGLGLTWTKRASNFAGGGGSVVYTATMPAAAQAPVVVTNAATSVTSSGATLNGSVNPEGQGTTYRFDYGTTTGYGTSVPSPAGSAGSGTSAVNENSAVTGLSASTTYHYRIEATNATGTTFGSDQQFTTTGQGGAPAVSSFTPTSGPSGTSVTITGSGFTGATAVKFNGTTATFTVTSDTQITATVPAAATTGPVAVTTPGGTGTSTASFTVTGTAPAVSSFTPTSGPSGTSVTITGSGFTGATAVKFNGTTATFTVTSDTQITATVPAAATTGPVAVTTPGGTGTSTASFTVTGTAPAVSSFTPTSGPSGTSVTITGSGFTGATAVKFNGTTATFTVTSDTQITATVPAAATTGPVAVTTPGGTGTSTASFTVTGTAPAVSSFTPTSGAAGTSVTITGSGFTGATAVKFNGTTATFTVTSDTQITATVPAAATTGPVAVTTPGGTGTSTASFTVTGTAPAVSSFTPTSGAAGTSVTITGSGFTGATAVKFNGTTATFTVTSDTQITATVPAAATTGPVAVTTPGGTGTSTASFTVSAASQAPAVVTTTASGVTSSAATLNGNVNPEGQTTTYHFEYGTTTSYGTTIPSPDGSAGSGTSAVNESSSLTGLTASTTYHYRLDATNGTGTTNGSDQQFTTSAGGGSSDTVTATVNGSPAGSSLKVLVLTGATEAGGAGNAAEASSGTAATWSLTPNQSNSLLLEVIYDETGGSSGEFTAVSGTTLADNSIQHDAFADGYYTGTVTSGTPVTLGTSTPTSDKKDWASYEILPSGGSSPSLDASTPAVAIQASSNTVTTASFIPPAGSVLVALVTGNNASTATVTDSSGLTWTARSHFAGSGGIAALFTATVAGGGGGPAPVVSSFTPTSGPSGTSVTITGSGFTGASAVKFNGTTATFTVTSDTQITATVPTGATTGPVAVTTPGGTGTSTASFTVTGQGGAPAVASFTPTSGPSGTSVTITGTGFTGATAVKFNGTTATFTVTSDTQITATVPTGATTGPVAVTTPAGTGTSTTSFTVTATGQTRKIVVIVEENESRSDIVGNTGQAPYLNQLIANGKLFTNYTEASGNGSLLNYLAMTGGQTTAPVPNIFQAIDSAGGTLTWKEFMESMGGNCATGSTANVPGTSDSLYTASHDPGFQDQVTDTCSTNDVPLTSSTFNPASLPDFSYVVPNECNDMHTLPTNGQACPAYFGSNPGTSQINIGDNWLAAVVPSLLAQPNVTVLITWDEGRVDNTVTTIEVGAGVTPGSTDGNAYNHYNLEAGLYNYFGLGTAPGNGATATPLPFPTRTP